MYDFLFNNQGTHIEKIKNSVIKSKNSLFFFKWNAEKCLNETQFFFKPVSLFHVHQFSTTYK